MFRFKKKPSSGSHSQCLAKITRLVQCWYRRRADVSAMAVWRVYCALCKCILLSETFLVLRRNERVTITNAYWCASKVPGIIVKYNWNCQSFEKYSKSKFRDNPSSGSRVPCGRTDGRTGIDVTKLMVAFHNFANAPKISGFLRLPLCWKRGRILSSESMKQSQ